MSNESADGEPTRDCESNQPSRRRRIGRIFFRLGIAGFVLLLLTLGTSYFWIDPAVSTAIEVAGADAVGATVTLKKVTLDIFNGGIDLKELRIDNPPGYEKPFFFDMKSAEVKIRLRTVFDDKIVLPEVVLNGITIYLEPNDDGEYNHEKILANIEKYTKTEEADPKTTDETVVVIERLVLRDIKVYYKTKFFISAPVHLSEKVLTNVGSDGDGVTLGEVLSIVIVGSLTGTAKELPKAIGGGIVMGAEAIGGAFKSVGLGITGGFKGIFGIGKKKEEKPEENAKADEDDDK